MKSALRTEDRGLRHPRFRHRPGGSPRHKPKLGLTVYFTPATRLDVPESQLGSRTGLSTPDLSRVRIQGDLVEEWVARLAGHWPGVGQRDAGDDVAVVVVVVLDPVAHRICLNCSRITPVSVGSSLSVSGVLSRPGTT